MPRISCFFMCLALLASTLQAQARGGFNPDCRVPRISLCPGCAVDVKIIVLRDHQCHINYGSLGPMRPQQILFSAKRGKYWAENETSTFYSPAKGFVGSDYFESRFEYEQMNGKPAFAILKAGVEVIPHF